MSNEITTIVSFPPPILQYFDPYLLLDYIERLLRRVQTIIIPKSAKKIRLQDVGKRRDFDKLLIEFHEVYERKTIEKAEYKAKIKEKAQKRPHIPNSGGVMRFKRMDTGK